MSGGTLTDHRYDTYRLSEWADNIRYELGKDYHGDDAKTSLSWLADLLADLERCLHDVDMTLSGDSSDERAINSISEFRQKWYQGVGPTMGDLIDIGVAIDNARTRIESIKSRVAVTEPDKMDWHGLRRKDDE